MKIISLFTAVISLSLLSSSCTSTKEDRTPDLPPSPPHHMQNNNAASVSAAMISPAVQ